MAAARAYIDALVSHDASAVPLAPDAVRYEMGLKTGRSGAHIARSLERGPQFRVIEGVRDVTAWREGETVRTRYAIDTTVLGVNLVVAQVTEEFEVRGDAAIHRIDARIRPRPGPVFRRRGRGRKG
ncbi:hypothetical protein FO059_08770 [Tomitella fengzijianii]|uniref:DUF8021 domain-containing protein n=1 Tax=Tomitella fengzijianii TaxID=2597660 RepID=A0A516X803_9ACTN|nr:hypothetical protein FO059_08770 [Tomitella fengzijianii]